MSWLPNCPRCSGARSALILTYSAYVAEVFRAGIESVHPSQRAAARSLGLSYGQTMRHVVVPQAVRRVLPPLLNDLVSLQKDTGLISVLGVIYDAVLHAQIETAKTFNYTPYVVAGLLFVLLTDPDDPAHRLDRPAGKAGPAPGATYDGPRLGRRNRANPPLLEIAGLRKSYGAAVVLRDVSLSVQSHRVRRADRRLGIGQVDPAAVRQPARDRSTTG